MSAKMANSKFSNIVQAYTTWYQNWKKIPYFGSGGHGNGGKADYSEYGNAVRYVSLPKWRK